MSKKTVWFQVEEHETMEACLERMKKEGYMPVGRKEEPLFEERDGQAIPIRQIIKFKGNKIEK